MAPMTSPAVRAVHSGLLQVRTSGSIVIVVLVSALAGCSRDRSPARRAAPPSATVQVVPRTPSIATYSCTRLCHARLTPNPTQRTLSAFHTDKRLAHGATLTWCVFCHQDDDLDRLRLIGGETVSFDESYRVCAQCHAERHRDWTRGVHGSTTGSWRDVAQRRSCTACHNPHDPHRAPFNALPPPSRERGHEPESHHE
jgi:hypothetical protein